MPDANNMELLGDYARNGSEEAFAELVRRHIALVYSAALRHVGIPAQAEEITQAVFIILSRKAASLRPGTILEGWLHETTRLTALHFLRGERRRQFREQEAYMQSTLPAETSAWNEMSPLLDEALARLGKTDRDAVILRFFKDKSVRDVATTMQMNEAATQRRILRALEKLRKFFLKRGVVSTTAIIAGAVSANAVQAAPVSLAKSVSVATFVKGASVPISTLTLVKGTMKTMTWLKIKFAAMTCASLIAAIAVSTVVIAQTKSTGVPALVPVTVVPNDSLLIIPHVSVGKVKAGMTEDDVIAALGQPETKQGEVLVYDKQFGFSVVCSRQKKVGAVFCGGGVAFSGHTKEGIGIGSSRDELIKTFGQPTSDKPWGPGLPEQAIYQRLGLTFTFQDGKIYHIVVDLR